MDSSGKLIYVNHSLPQSCTLYFRQGAEGWTAPSWRGCKTAVWGNPPQQDNGASGGLNPAKGQVYITAFSQNKACVPSDAQLTITWNTPVEKALGCIRILDSSNREVYSLEVSSGAVSVSGAAMSFSLAGALLRYGQTYSIKLDNGIVKSQAGVYFHGLEAGEWIITINRPSDTVNMSWAQKPFWQFGGDDYDKPPIPNGTDTQYANQLLLWAQDAGYYGLTIQQCLAMLDAPMYFPVTDQNQTPLLLNDRATTVRQVVEDILFVEALQERIQEQITEPLSDVSLSKAASNPWLLLTSVIPQETKIYETAISWYDQIETYMGQRNQNSNFFLSLGAPAAYVALCEALGMTGDVRKPMLKADFKSFTEQQFMHSLNQMADYATFSDSVDEIKLAYQTGKTLYTAVSRNHLGSVVSLGADCLKSYFGASESPVLQEISNAWNTATDTYSAAKNSILLGSSTGMFPLVIDLRNGIVNDLKKQVKAAYFIGDYYIAQEEPALYQLIFGEDGFLHSTSYFASQTTDLNQILFWKGLGMQYDVSQYSNVTRNWVRLLDSTRAVDNFDDLKEQEESIVLRREFSNYVLILRTAASMDVQETKDALSTYLARELQAQGYTSIFAKCPVRVNVYDVNHTLVASLSSEDDLTQWEYGTMYLTGAENEGKLILLPNQDYQTEILPYGDGSMKLMIERTQEDGGTTTVYYEDVAISKDVPLTCKLDGETVTLSGAAGTISPTEEISVTELLLTAPAELAAGTTSQASCTVYPMAASDREITWQSSDSSVLCISNQGELKAVAPGRATITATTRNGVTQSAEIHVYAAVTELTCDLSSITLLEGETIKGMVTTEPQDAAVVWSSSDFDIAAVNADGTIYAVSPGEAYITAEADGLSRTIMVTVQDTPVALELGQIDTDGDYLEITGTNISQADTVSGKLYVSIYQENGKYVGGAIHSVELLPGEMLRWPVMLESLQPETRYRVRVFITDLSYVPLQEFQEVVCISSHHAS